MQRAGQMLTLALSLVVAMTLGVIPVQASAEKARPPGVHAFDHAATGFPLLGGHATTSCKSCHVGGEFKGTPRRCDGCHALGRRVVATPKPSNHLLTNAPCETCHFTTVTFQGARFNHGTAVPGQCTSCHNGVITRGRPSDHTVGLRLTGSCDNCHRSFAWVPAGYNHFGVAPHSCDNAGCHVQGANPDYKPANHQTTPYLDRNTFYCDECHNYYSWLPGRFMHDRPSPVGICMGCHDGTNAPGQNAGHIATTSDCNTCHLSTVSWLGATGAMPANHIPFNPGATCSVCHPTPATWVTGAALHVQVSPVCKTCHDTHSPAYLGNMQRVTLGSHQGSTLAQDCTSCHALNYTTWSN